MSRGKRVAARQQVVVYDDAETGRACVYTTAYDDEQARRGVMQCLMRYGKGAAVRTVNT